MKELTLDQILNQEIGRDRNLGRAIRKLEVYLTEFPDTLMGSRLEEIKGDYLLMREYLRKGYPDPQREGVYRQLLDRLFVLVQDVGLHEKIKSVPVYQYAWKSIRHIRFQEDSIRKVLEDFVADMAMLGLEPEEKRQEKAAEIQDRHYRQMSMLFNAIFVSEQWRDAEMEFYTQLILSPTIDGNDARLLVSAVMLACINIFDIRKWETLARVLKGAPEERLRQRALVGWVLSVDGSSDLFPRQAELVAELTKDDQFCQELLELQEQIFYCMNADRDNQKIQEDIMPNLLKGNQFNVTRFGITEKEEDPMEDVLHPEEADRNTAEVEKGIRQMADMEKQGSDIYFGGFSQMKRFPFFDTLSNWFVPFYIGHPELNDVRQKLGKSKFLNMLLEDGPFCDSDKYSFALAMRTVLDRLPDNLREMLNSGEAMLGPAVSELNRSSRTFIRRSYLQDLYRFYRINTYKEDFRNPFVVYMDGKAGSGFFFVSRLFCKTPLKNQVLALAHFLSKLGYDKAEKVLLDTYRGDSQVISEPFWVTLGYNALCLGEYALACDYFGKALEMNPNDPSALKGRARACLTDQRMKEAERDYVRLTELFPQQRSYHLNLCIARIGVGRVDEAINELYRLDLELPDNRNVHRVLAWGLLCQGKAEQAEREYDKLLKHTEPDADDYLNAGYCKWMLGKIDEALALFRTFNQKAPDNRSEDLDENLERQMQQDAKFLHSRGFTDTDIKLMCDLCRENS